MEIYCISLGGYSENTYVVATGRWGVVIDPGIDVEQLRCFVRKKGITLRAVLLTHAHYDHILALPYLNLPVYLHELDVPLLRNVELNASLRYDRCVAYYGPVRTVEDQEIIRIGPNWFRLHYAPGHTPGSCVWEAPGRVLFTGDTLLAQRSTGDINMGTSSPRHLLESIYGILHMDKDAVLLPGHGPGTTVFAERKFRRENPEPVLTFWPTVVP